MADIPLSGLWNKTGSIILKTYVLEDAKQENKGESLHEKENVSSFTDCSHDDKFRGMLIRK